MAELQYRYDRTVGKVNQTYVVGLLLLAWLLGEEKGGVFLIAITGGIMAVGTAFPQWNPFRLSYTRIFRPLGLLRPDVVAEDPTAHRFAFGLGAIFLTASLLTFTFSLPVVPWVLSWIVLVLAFVNLTVNF